MFLYIIILKWCIKAYRNELCNRADTRKSSKLGYERGLARELSARSGVPQSHISKIESGSVDLRISSLIALARVLDLELLVAPKSLYLPSSRSFEVAKVLTASAMRVSQCRPRIS